MLKFVPTPESVLLGGVPKPWSDTLLGDLGSDGVGILFWAGGLAVVSTIGVILWLRSQREELRRRRVREAWLHAAEWGPESSEGGQQSEDNDQALGTQSASPGVDHAGGTYPISLQPSASDVTRAGDVLDVMGSFAAGIASEFSDQLTTILGHTELLQEREDLDLELNASLSEIHAAAEAGRRATMQLMAFGSTSIRRTGIHSLVDLVQGASNHAISRCGGEVNQHFSPCASAVEGNLSELREALEALLINALEASRDKIVSVRCEAATTDKSQDGEQDFVRISILDDGPGLPPGSERQIFQPGFSTKPSARGMGLSVALTMATRNGGRIVLKDADGVTPNGSGTLAELYLRRAVSFENSIPDRVHKRKHERSARVVLLVEDQDCVLRLEQLLLENEGCYVLVASSGEAALEVIRENQDRIDLLVTDVSLPGIDGVELAERMQEIAPGTPSIFVSGMCQDEELRSQLLGTAPHFIQKPFSKDEFIATVTSAMEVVGGRGRKRALVVDDEPVTRRIVRAIVESNDMECVVASDGSEALGLMERAHFDLVITDIVMPVLDGVDLCRSISKRFPGVHLIAMSGNRAGRPGLQAATSFGAELILSKPFSRDEMTLAIREVLEDRIGGSGFGNVTAA